MSKRKSIPDVMGTLQGLGTPLPVEPAEQPEERLAPLRPPSRDAALPATRREKNKTPKKRLAGRATYDIGVELKQAIYRESIELGVPASQLAKYLLLYAWDFYVSGDIPEPALEKSDSPKFRNRVEF
ncbi:MAG: hypothetical protein KC415_14695 [Anaerolineales bacterium]|nr:hypothetical protein [Anaerolineales bacterium]